MILVVFVICATIYWDFSQILYLQHLNEPISWDKYIIRLLFLLTTVFLAGIFFSHKIIGPLNRLEKMARNINRGEFDVKIKLRIGDDFKRLGTEMNELAEKLKNLSEKYPQIKEEFEEENKS